MAEAGVSRGYKYIAITDHSKNLAMTNGLDENGAREQIKRNCAVVKYPPPEHLVVELDEDGLLTAGVRRAIAERVLARLEESSERYAGQRQKLRFILQSQARHLAGYLRAAGVDEATIRQLTVENPRRVLTIG